MPEPRVFVSHSTPKEDLVRRGFLEDVCKALKAKGYVVLVDYETLAPGDWWRERLHQWLADCDAAVILLSRRAASENPWWVRHESSVLIWRKFIDKDFKLLPVWLEGVTAVDLVAPELAPLNLQELQSSQPRTAGEIADTLGTPAVIPKTPLERWAELLADIIELGRRRGEAEELIGVADAMGIPVPSGIPSVLPRARAIAKEIARKLACIGPPLFYEHLDVLASALNDRAMDELLRAVAPAWISPGAARELHVLSADSPPKSAVINGNHIPNFTGKLYVQRAFWPSKKWVVFHTRGTVDQHHIVDSLARSILEDVRNHPKVRARINSDPEDFLRKADFRIFIVLHVHVGKADLADLQKRFPRTIFVLGGGTPFGDDAWRDYPARVLRPLLEPDTEEEALSTYDNCRSALAGEERP